MTDSADVVRGFMEAFSAGRVTEALACLTPDATWWVAGDVPGLSGTKSKDEVGELLVRLTALTREGAIRLEPSGWTVDGERVAVEATARAELLAGPTYCNQYHFLFETSRSRVRRVRAYLDTEHLRAVFGA